MVRIPFQCTAECKEFNLLHSNSLCACTKVCGNGHKVQLQWQRLKQTTCGLQRTESWTLLAGEHSTTIGASSVHYQNVLAWATVL